MPDRSSAPNSAPVLLTERLRLRAHTLDDYEAVYALRSSPDVVRYIGGRPYTREEVWMRLLSHVGHWSLLRFGLWLVEEVATGESIGEVGLFDYHRDIDPPFGSVPEFGWVLATSAHGKGFATEAVSAVLTWADTHLDVAEFGCLIHPENAASLRVAAKMGFIERGRTTHRETPYLLLFRARRLPLK